MGVAARCSSSCQWQKSAFLFGLSQLPVCPFSPSARWPVDGRCVGNQKVPTSARVAAIEALRKVRPPFKFCSGPEPRHRQAVIPLHIGKENEMAHPATEKRGGNPDVKHKPEHQKPKDAMERKLEQGLEESMTGSDPVSVTQPPKTKDHEKKAGWGFVSGQTHQAINVPSAARAQFRLPLPLLVIWPHQWLSTTPPRHRLRNFVFVQVFDCPVTILNHQTLGRL